MVIRTAQTPTDDQLAIIETQIGRTPQGIQAITAMDGQGTPLVLRMESVVNGKPFPTLYWLSSDRLKIALSRIEASGVIKQLEARLQDDPDFLAAYWRSHEDYVAQRWHYMRDEHRQQAEQRGYIDLFRQRGIGGIANWHQVRCLHTQYAHHLCGDNVIGQWLDAEYGVIDDIP
ncbi:DUF501 domain-containing protein [Halomonas sp. PR-M31]|uniref:DUF501 domain-containing protein n=1 Tax=Halomonas sp. PR-M31 TaxID=1471202 RepID=UPI000651EC50|nr:DUF501 domain-containing protein [Halomonas sp. PR-M31]